MNPFESNSSQINYKDVVRGQIEGMEVGESKVVDTGSKSIFEFRVNLAQEAKMQGKHFKTKKSFTGEVWMLRDL